MYVLAFNLRSTSVRGMGFQGFISPAGTLVKKLDQAMQFGSYKKAHDALYVQGCALYTDTRVVEVSKLDLSMCG